MLEAFGLLAGTLTGLSFFPQAFRVIRTRNTVSISLATYIAYCIGVLFWIIYGVIKQLPSIYICNIITIIPALIVLSVKIKNRKEDQTPHA